METEMRFYPCTMNHSKAKGYWEKRSQRGMTYEAAKRYLKRHHLSEYLICEAMPIEKSRLEDPSSYVHLPGEHQ